MIDTITKDIFLHKAEMLAECFHCDKTYDDSDYVKHLQDVVDNLIKFGFGDDLNLLAAGWLHDTVEDTQLKLKLVEKYFNKEVADIVHCVTNELGRNRKERNEKTYPKLRNNQRAVTVKLADRISNLEQSIRKQNLSYYDMYRKEYPSFRYALYEPNHNEQLWLHLDELMKYE